MRSRMVIGVAADLKYSRINEAPRPYFYQPIHQVYRTAMVLLRARRRSVDTLAIRRAPIAPRSTPICRCSTRGPACDLRGAFIFYDFTAMMLFIFGLAGMALAALGTYGLVSYTVKQSTREIGIRMALGANHFMVVRGFLARGLRLGPIGAALGIVTALSASGLLSSVLFGVSTTDVMAFMRAGHRPRHRGGRHDRPRVARDPDQTVERASAPISTGSLPQSCGRLQRRPCGVSFRRRRVSFDIPAWRRNMLISTAPPRPVRACTFPRLAFVQP